MDSDLKKIAEFTALCIVATAIIMSVLFVVRGQFAVGGEMFIPMLPLFYVAILFTKKENLSSQSLKGKEER